MFELERRHQVCNLTSPKSWCQWWLLGGCVGSWHWKKKGAPFQTGIIWRITSEGGGTPVPITSKGVGVVDARWRHSSHRQETKPTGNHESIAPILIWLCI